MITLVTNIISILLTLLLCISVMFIIRYHWSRRRLYYCASKMAGPPAWPIVGNGFYFMGGTKEILDNAVFLTSKYQSPFRVWIGNKLVCVINKPKDLEVILNGCLHKDPLYDLMKPMVGNGLFSGPVDTWRRHRKVIMPTFNQKILNGYVEIFAKHSNILVEKLQWFEGKGNFDVFPILSRCTLDIVSETVLGVNIDAQNNDKGYVKWVGRAMEIAYERIFHFWLHPDFIWKQFPISTEGYDLCDKCFEFLGKIITERKEEYRSSKFDSSNRKSFLDCLIRLSEEGNHWTDKEIMDETSTITIGGSDSTGSMDSFALMMLGMHPEIQEKVFEEIHEIFGDSSRDVTPEDLPKFVYLERVIKETMRLFPVGPIILRALHDDVKLDSYILPKGVCCAITIIHTHRDPDLWPNPLKFDPDRFLPEETAKRHPYAYIPFSGGPRGCIGMRFAMMAMKSVISTVLRHYKVSTDYKKVEDVKLKADIMIKAADGYRVAFKYRNSHIP